MNIFTKFAQWHLTKQYKKQQKKRQTGEFEKNKEVYQNLKNLLDFVRWLNTKGLSNRAQRKAFWAKIKAGEPILETTLKNIIAQYYKRISKVEVIKEEAKKPELKKHLLKI